MGAPPEGHWRDHRAFAALVRVAAALGPLLMGALAGLGVAVLLPDPHTAPALAGWWLIVLGVSVIGLRLCDRLARRLLPLAVLLELSLLFPEQAPSRFRVALTSGSTKHLHDHVAAAQRAGVEGDPTMAAEAILSLVAGLGSHHRPSRQHSERVRAYTELVADELGLSARDRHRLRWASLLHDVGKVSVPLDILEGTGALSEEGWAVIQRHPREGARLIAPLREWLGPWAPTVEQHHERFDGGGYPRGLKGDEICLGARIVAVADSFEAMTARRSYQEPMPMEAARARLASLAGTQFDPVAVRAFLAVSMGKLRWAYGPVAWAAEAPALLAIGKLAPAVGASVRAGAAVVGVAVAANVAGAVPNVQVLGRTYERPAPVTGSARVPVRVPVPVRSAGTQFRVTPAGSPLLPVARSVQDGSVSDHGQASSSTSTTTTTLVSVVTTAPTVPTVPTMPPTTLPPVTVPPLTVPTIAVTTPVSLP
ncbi:MAG: hypothetical protein QOI20_1439 [Acidimicrobiaceae bacterium]|nr:hypothetical protein [Acidimicrobiaceae bacterium]